MTLSRGIKTDLNTLLDNNLISQEQYNMLVQLISSPVENVVNTGLCELCKCWVINPDLGGGDCRRYAPKPRLNDGIKKTTVWPNTKADDWCLEFIERK